MKFRFCIVLFLCWIVSSCATWYQRTAAFQDAVSKGEFEQAEKLLQKDKKQARDKNKILYYLNQGYVEFMLGHYEKSNQAFEIADRSCRIDLESGNPSLSPGRFRSDHD